MNQQDRWKRLELLLTSALHAEEQRLPPHDAEVIREYICNREYGLAYDHFKYALEAENIAAAKEAEVALQAAADLMNP